MFLRKGNVLGTGGRSVLFFGVYRVDFPTTAAAGTKLHGKSLTNNQPFRILRNKLEITFPLPPSPPHPLNQNAFNIAGRNSMPSVVTYALRLLNSS